MKYQRTAVGVPMMVVSVIVVILAASFAYYYATTESQVSTLNGQVSTLKGQVSSLNSSNAQLGSALNSNSFIYIRINPNSSISGITVSMSPVPIACQHGPTCLPVTVAECNPSSFGVEYFFCTSVNTQANFATRFAFQGVKQGYYWLDFERKLGNNATQGTIRMIHVLNDTTYYVTANITASLATADISITNSTSR